MVRTNLSALYDEIVFQVMRLRRHDQVSYIAPRLSLLELPTLAFRDKTASILYAEVQKEAERCRGRGEESKELCQKEGSEKLIELVTKFRGYVESLLQSITA